MKNQLLQALQTLRSDPSRARHTWVRPYRAPADPDRHQLAFFLKPEVMYLGGRVDVPSVIELALQELEKAGFEMGAVRLVNGAYLREHRIMDAHYGVLNTISKQGRAAITPGAEATLQQAFAAPLAAGADVLGAHQFLEQVPAFSPLALSVLSDNLGSTKLGGGTYALPVNLLGRDLIVLNAFHPYQLEPYYADEYIMVIMELRSSRPWTELRRQFAGATNPAKAAEGSLRNSFLQHQQRLGLADVSPGANGLHLSAGPLEGMVELQRFLGDPETGQILSVADTSFGTLLRTAGAEDTRIEELADNPTLERNGQLASAFDLTEEMDAEPAVKTLLTD